jgi:hypothetical protein
MFAACPCEVVNFNPPRAAFNAGCAEVFFFCSMFGDVIGSLISVIFFFADSVSSGAFLRLNPPLVVTPIVSSSVFISTFFSSSEDCSLSEDSETDSSLSQTSSICEEETMQDAMSLNISNN